MLPLISANDNWNVRRQQSRAQALYGLPDFTSSMNMGFAPFERTSSPWKHHVPNRSSPMKSYDRIVDEEDTRMSTKKFSNPQSVIAARSFRSSTILRQVPIMRRHLDTFGGRMFSIPVKTKPVPVHTGRFLYDPMCPPTFADKLSQNQRLQAEMDMMKKVRGQKRKREALEHRWGWRNFDLSGMEVVRNQRYSIHAEVKKLKELVLPPAAREIYTGRGIRLPSTHQTFNPPRVRPYTEGTTAPPSSAARRVGTFPNLRAPVTAGGQHTRVAGQLSANARIPAKSPDTPARLQSQQSQPSPKLVVQSGPAPGTQVSPSPTKLDAQVEPGVKEEEPKAVEEKEPKQEDTGPIPAANIQQSVRMHEPVETVEVVDPDVEDEETRAKSDLALIPETPIERPRSMAAPSASPETGAPNPMLPMVEDQAEPLISESVQKLLKQQFEELQKKGDVTFDDILGLSSESLRESQRRFLRCLHDVSAHGTAWVFQELIAYTCLSRIIQNLSPSTAEMYEQCNFATLPESVVQYTELFNSVDRVNRGQIGITALLEILNTSLQRQITSDEKLLNQVLKTLEKEKGGSITKLEFLAYIPYFTHLEEMS